MVCHALQTGYDVGEDHAGFGAAFALGQTLYMESLEFFLLVVDALFQFLDILQVGIVSLHEGGNRVLDQGVDHIQHLTQFLLGFLAEACAILFALSGCVGNVLGVIADTLDVVHHVEQGTDALQIFDGQCGLVDLPDSR